MALYSIFMGWCAIKAKNMRRHRGAMVDLYVGGMLIAAGFTLTPGRLLHGWVFD